MVLLILALGNEWRQKIRSTSSSLATQRVQRQTILKKQQEQNTSETFKNLQKFILFVHFLWKVLEDVQKTINPKKQSKGKSEHHNWGINQKNNL